MRGHRAVSWLCCGDDPEPTAGKALRDSVELDVREKASLGAQGEGLRAW